MSADLTINSINQVLRKITEVPTLPSSVFQLMQLLEDTECSAADVAKLLNSDPAMAAKVLKLANSSYYGFRQTINSVTQAVTVLGFSTLKNALLSVSVFELFRRADVGIDLPGLWTHSMGTAMAARLIAQKVRFPNMEKAYTVGLLHDLGKILIARHVPLAMIHVVQIVKQETVAMHVAEMRVLGTTHAELGCWLLQRWHLPPSVADAVRLHHNPTATNQNFDLAAIVYLANAVCHQACLGQSGNDRPAAIDARIADYFGFTERHFAQIGQSVRERQPEIEAFTQMTARAA